MTGGLRGAAVEQSDLVARLTAAAPGWPEWAELVELVGTKSLSLIEDECLGSYLTSGANDPDTAEEGGGRLTFRIPRGEFVWPAWVPAYVPALWGLIAADYSLAGGYAGAFIGHPTEQGYAFAGGVGDEQLGFPILPVPPGCYPFQDNSSGALFHLSADLRVLYPDAQRGRFSVLDSLEAFTRTNVRQALAGRLWFEAYQGLDADILD
jgi:hypothetical protein